MTENEKELRRIKAYIELCSYNMQMAIEELVNKSNEYINKQSNDNSYKT